jgi:hypothetical protein
LVGPRKAPINTAPANVAKAQAINNLINTRGSGFMSSPDEIAEIQEADCRGHRGDASGREPDDVKYHTLVWRFVNIFFRA